MCAGRGAVARVGVLKIKLRVNASMLRVIVVRHILDNGGVL